jgi:hypothetical protein
MRDRFAPVLGAPALQLRLQRRASSYRYGMDGGRDKSNSRRRRQAHRQSQGRLQRPHPEWPRDGR